VLGGLLSWAGAASFAELGAALPLNGGMQEYLRHVFGNTMAFLMAWIYIMAVKPSAMAIQSIVIAESIGSVSSYAPLSPAALKSIAVVAFVFLVIVNSINTRTTLRMNEAFTAIKISTVALVVCGGFIAVAAHFINPSSSLSPSKDWYTRDWLAARPTQSGGDSVDWATVGAWERYGHYSTAIYAGLWAYDGWDNVSLKRSKTDFYTVYPTICPV
jgi:amino acid transporter